VTVSAISRHVTGFPIKITKTVPPWAFVSECQKLTGTEE
jgi:hypothetical protein